MHSTHMRLSVHQGRFIVVITAALQLIFGAQPNAWAQPSVLQIDGDPLDIYCYETGQMALWYQGVYQYFSEDSWGSVLMFDDGETTLKYADPYHAGFVEEGEVTVFTGISNTQTSDWRIDTVMGAGDSGVSITRTVQYTNGNSYYKMTWSITNGGGTTYTNCKFIHGGDAYFGGDDAAQSYWDPNLGMVYLRNPGLSGLMGFYGGLGSAAGRYYGGEYYTGVEQAIAGELGNTVDSNFIDAGYHLQWNRATLAPGQTWVITAYEKWTEAGDVQVLAPSEQTGAAGDTLDLSFLVQNFQGSTDTFDLIAVSENGWSISLPYGDTVTLDSGESTYVTVRVVLPGGEGATDDTITLTATSQADAEVTNSDSVAITRTYESGSLVVTGREHGGPCFIETARTSAHAHVLVILCGVILGLIGLPRRLAGKIASVLVFLAAFVPLNASAADEPTLQFGISLGYTDFSKSEEASYEGVDFDLKVMQTLNPGLRMCYNANTSLGVEMGATYDWYHWDLNPSLPASSKSRLRGYTFFVGPVFSISWGTDVRFSFEPALIWRMLDFDLNYPYSNYKSGLGGRMGVALSKGDVKAEIGWTASHHKYKDALDGANDADYLDLNGYFINLVYYFYGLR